MRYHVQILKRRRHPIWENVKTDQLEFQAIPMARALSAQTGERTRVASPSLLGHTVHNVLWDSGRAA